MCFQNGVSCFQFVSTIQSWKILCTSKVLALIQALFDCKKKRELLDSMCSFVSMIFRTAALSDIKQIQVVRHLVKENILRDPGRVTDQDVAYYISVNGKGWVCEAEGLVVGFSIADLADKSVWALFVRPDFAERGIGKELHRLMLDWYFKQTKEKLVLGTSPDTRADRFYRLQGWKPVGRYANGDTQFEMSYEDWNRS
jgi:GNAT superfamily N-acetyltransferase